jgi:hypothetical protein
LPSLRQPSLQPRRAWPPQTAASRRRPFGKAACLLLLRLRRRLLSTAHSTHCRRSSRTSSRLRQPLLQAHSACNAALDHAAGQWTNSCLDAASSLPLQLGCKWMHSASGLSIAQPLRILNRILTLRSLQQPLFHFHFGWTRGCEALTLLLTPITTVHGALATAQRSIRTGQLWSAGCSDVLSATDGKACAYTE